MESRLTSARREDFTTDNYANCLRVSTGYGFPGRQVSLGAQLGLVGRVTTTRSSRYVLWSACQRNDVGRLNGFCYWMLCCGSCDPRVVQGKWLRENDVTSPWTTSGRMLELLGARRAQLIRLTTRRSAVNASRRSLSGCRSSNDSSCGKKSSWCKATGRVRAEQVKHRLLVYPLNPKSFTINQDDVKTGNRISTRRWTTGNVPTRNRKLNAYQKMDDHWHVRSSHFYHVKSKLHFTCAAVQASKRPSVSRLSLQQLPHHMYQVRPQRDLDALTLQPATPLAAASSSCQHPSATRHHLHRPPPPRHHYISLSLPEESPLFLMHLSVQRPWRWPALRSSSVACNRARLAARTKSVEETQKPTHSICKRMQTILHCQKLKTLGVCTPLTTEL